MDYRSQEEKLFSRWIKRAQKLHDGQEIAKDGILYRGELWFDGFGQVHRPGTESENWDQSRLRLLVLTKEVYDEDCWDIRSESGRVPSPHLDNGKTAKYFFPNLELWAYGLMNTSDRRILSFDKADNQPKLQQFYETAPIARVNCKKQIDSRAASNAVIQKYMKNYADLLVEQINMYHANIILCCGGQGIIVSFLQEYFLKDLVEVNAHCYYSEEANVVVVKSFYPAYYVYSRKEMYTNMMRDYQSFLKTHPQFPGNPEQA